jgi:hypothetical protein
VPPPRRQPDTLLSKLLDKLLQKGADALYLKEGVAYKLLLDPPSNADPNM